MRSKPKLLGDMLDEQFKRFGVTTVVQAIEKLTSEDRGMREDLKDAFRTVSKKVNK